MIKWNNKVVPVATISNEEETNNLLSCLQESGLKVVEITYRTSYASQAIKHAITKYPQIIVGAGTIINTKQCKSAIKSGAKFIVGPGFSKKVAKMCKRLKVLYTKYARFVLWVHQLSITLRLRRKWVVK